MENDRFRIALNKETMDKLEEMAGAVGLTPAQYVRFMVFSEYNKGAGEGGFPASYKKDVRRRGMTVQVSDEEVQWMDETAARLGLSSKGQLIRLALGKFDE